MIAQEKQETKELAYIPMSNTRSDPWTMMIMDLDTKSTLFAVKSSWRS
jgi:hypothetical protein